MKSNTYRIIHEVVECCYDCSFNILHSSRDKCICSKIDRYLTKREETRAFYNFPNWCPLEKDSNKIQSVSGKKS